MPSTTTSSYTQRQREVVRQLGALLAWRGEVQDRVETAHRTGVEEAQASCEQKLADLAAWRGHIVQQAAAEREQALARTRPPFEAELGAATQKMGAEVAAFTARSNSMVMVANERLEESRWLADTLVESSESRSRAQFEAVRKSVQKKQDEIEAMRALAAQILEQRRHGPLPELAAEGAPTETSVKALLEQLQDDCESLRVCLHQLERRASPAMLSVPGVLAGAAAAGGLAALLILWQSPEAALPLWGRAVGFAFLAGLVLMVVMRLLARRRVPRAAGFFAAALARATGSVQRCRAQAQGEREREVRAAHVRREQELREAHGQHESVRREVERRREIEGPRLREQHYGLISAIQQRYGAAVAQIEEAHRRRVEEATEAQQQGSRAALEERDRQLSELQNRYQQGWRDLEEHWRGSMAKIEVELGELTARAAALWPAWERLPGRTSPEDLPPAARFGVMDVDLAALPGGVPSDPRLPVRVPPRFDLPATLDLLGRGSLVLEHPGEARGQAIAGLNAIMLRLLTTFPPGKVRFTIIDPVGLGESFAGFMHLADYEAALVSDRIWTDPRHIEQKLADLTEHMETVIQKYLRNEYECIQDYNEEAGEIAEPFRFLVIADFPANFTEASTKRLASILSSGARCGVFTLIAVDTSGGSEAAARARGGSARLPHWIPMEEIERASNTLAWEQGAFRWRDEDFGRFPLALESPPSQELLTGILHELGKAARDSSRVQVPFAAIAPREGGMWSRSAALDVNVPLGRSGARKVQHLTLGRGTAQHALIAGRTGSGKSNLLHVLITSAALWYSPREVELYLVDFKKGVEFKTYAAHRLPHARVIAIESEREFGLSVLRRLDAELTRRGTLFREAGGGGVQDVAAYRRETGKILPRILLIVDEFQEFFVEDDRIAQEASLLLDRLVRQGRAFGMHVVLGSQTLGGAYSIARSTIGQMAVRIALQCSEADCYLIMSEDNHAPRLLSRPGEAIYNDASGMVEGNSPFQAVFLPDEVRDLWVPRTRAALAESGLAEPPPPIVFEGNLPARLEECRALVEALSGEAPALPTIWLGEPVSIKDPTSVAFQRQSGSNLLIVGQQDESALALLTSAAMSLAGARPGRAHASGNGHVHGQRLVIMDGSAPDAPHAHVLDELAGQLPGEVRFARPRQAAAAITELGAELTRREQQEQAGQGGFNPVFVLVHGLHRFRDLRRGDDFSFGLEGRAVTAASEFTRLLRDGPPLGIHIIAWCDSVANLDRTLERSALREFEVRVLFQMSATDSTHLVDGPQASTLGRHRALLYHEEAGTAERFRPWALPDAAVQKRILTVRGSESPPRVP
jgi:DNA segregation ATPase FtsK/SpoIIIE, S-DNA-T family